MNNLSRKVKTIGAMNFTFTLYEDGSGEFSKAVNPKESIYLNCKQLLDVYDDIARFYGLPLAPINFNPKQEETVG